MADPELSYSRVTHLPQRPIQRLQRPLIAFTHIESASGIVLLIQPRNIISVGTLRSIQLRASAGSYVLIKLQRLA